MTERCPCRGCDGNFVLTAPDNTVKCDRCGLSQLKAFRTANYDMEDRWHEILGGLGSALGKYHAPTDSPEDSICKLIHTVEILTRILKLIANGIPRDGSWNDVNEDGWGFWDQRNPPSFWNRGTLTEVLRATGKTEEVNILESIIHDG